MKLIRYGAPGQEQPGIILSDGSRRSLRPIVHEIDEAFWESNGPELIQKALDQGESLPLVDNSLRLGPPVGRPSKLICIGLNYADHAKESGAKSPEEPLVFFKASTAICGPFDPVIIPPGSTKTDWEVELAVVVGKRATHVTVADAPAYIGGYLLHNDISERAYQLERGGQWVKGKSYDTFAPLGPWLVTPDEIADAGNLDLWLEVNGHRYQESNTREMIFSVPTLISYLSQFMTLLPGDIITTGTPAGVGLGLTPPKYLQPGDVMRLHVEGLGISQQTAMSRAER